MNRNKLALKMITESQGDYGDGEALMMKMVQYRSGSQRYMEQVTPENHGGSSAKGPTVPPGLGTHEG